MTDDVDVRARPADWSQVADLVEGARQRGFTETQVDYVRALIGICWAKAEAHGERLGRTVVAS